VYFGVFPSAPNTEAGSNEAEGDTKIASTATTSNTKKGATCLTVFVLISCVLVLN
jgi:hypothetical protein